jgi:hypothetical protein
MKIIYIEKNGVSMQVLNTNKFDLFNWPNFSKNDPVYFDDCLFAYFVSYEKSEQYGDEIIKLRIK